MGDKTKMVTKPLAIPKKSNVANAINQAAEFIQLAMTEENPIEKERYLANAIRWLETTRVTDTMPPSIESIRIRK